MSSIKVNYFQNLDALQIAIEFKLKKEAILAKNPEDENLPDLDPQENKKTKIVDLHQRRNRPVPNDMIRTFSNLVIKKEEKETSKVSQYKLKQGRFFNIPKMSLAQYRASNTVVGPNERGSTAPSHVQDQPQVFMTNIESLNMMSSNTGTESKANLINSKIN